MSGPEASGGIGRGFVKKGAETDRGPGGRGSRGGGGSGAGIRFAAAPEVPVRVGGRGRRPRASAGSNFGREAGRHKEVDNLIENKQ